MSLNLYVGPDSQPDKYRLVRSVGRGGEATLYLAEVSLAGQTEPVVVKVLNSDVTANEGQFAELSARWSEQAEMLRFINRLGVVGVREHFEGAPEHPADGAGEYSDRALYLVMNYVQGVDLRDWRAEHAVEGPRGQREALRYLEQVAVVLDVLHSGRATPSKRVVVHGDLSPGNIMISDEGQATLVDFGLSRIAARHMTARPWFTPGYAAPEIFNGEYSAATDRYAFGAIAFFALTGQDPPPSPEQLRERFGALPLVAAGGERQRELVASMFSAEPADRPGASDWIRALRSLATSAPWTGPAAEPGGALPPAGAPVTGAPPQGAPVREAPGPGPDAPTPPPVRGPGGSGPAAPSEQAAPPRPVGGMRGVPEQAPPPDQGPDRPSAPRPRQPGTAAHPSGPGPRVTGPNAPGRGGPVPAPSPQPPPRQAPAQPSGGRYAGPPHPGPPRPAPAGAAGPGPGWNTATGALPHHAAQAATGEAGPARRGSRKPLFVGLAVFGVLCMVAGAAGTYAVLDRFGSFSLSLQESAGDVQPDPAPAPEPSAGSGDSERLGAADEPASDGPGDPAPDSTLLTQMEAVDEESSSYWRPESGRAELDGEVYSRAIVPGFCAQHNSECTGWIDYNLGRDWSTFTTTIGVDDTSNAGATTTFTVHVDGEAEATETLRLGETMDVEVDVSGALRLRLEVESDARGIFPVWADPTLTGS
ncbi:MULTISPECIES: NPCBM/NEW2 domain-containing protein [unclassified Nocardiopsis]|uniref:protein kinase domain-containing protein n=1 Tax=unclassified Nocardiopsis TaxID=2649073 RepID=UPI001358CB77|nr:MULTISPECIES: NPCBM/NEW2 domain-containing protein [unclassified Nocardiopsis]